MHGLLGTLGLLGCESGAELVVVAPIELEPTGEGEPSARGVANSSEPASATTSIPESREWCGAIIDTRPRPLLRTSSFLLAWNEIRVADGRLPASPIPLNEHDARLTICGGPTCEVVEPRPIEFNEMGRIAIGTVIPGGGESLLVIPDISPFFVNSPQCASSTEMSSQRIGDLLQVSAEIKDAPPRMHHGYYHHYSGCYAQPGRHDVFVDVVTGMVELEIEHRAAVLGVSASDEGEGLHVTLTGCSDTLELTWTE